MKAKKFFIYLFLLSPIFTFGQEESEKITCQKLVSDHLSSCPWCGAGEKCEVRKDLLKFCSPKNKEQELIVIDSGPTDCGCPTYGYYYPQNHQYYTNYYQPYWGGHNYVGPSFQFGYGYVVNAGFSGYNNWNWNRAHYRNNYSMGGYSGYGGYNGFGSSHQNGGHQGNGGHRNNGAYHGNGGNHNQGGHHNNGGHNTRVHYGSRRGGG